MHMSSSCDEVMCTCACGAIATTSLTLMSMRASCCFASRSLCLAANASVAACNLQKAASRSRPSCTYSGAAPCSTHTGHRQRRNTRGPLRQGHGHTTLRETHVSPDDVTNGAVLSQRVDSLRSLFVGLHQGRQSRAADVQLVVRALPALRGVVAPVFPLVLRDARTLKSSRTGRDVSTARTTAVVASGHLPEASLDAPAASLWRPPGAPSAP
jgi:hypothetical protein